MASGDVFSNMYFSTSGTVTVQPASGVSAMISFMGSDSDNGKLYGKNSSGTYMMSLPNDAAGNTNIVRNMQGASNMKLFITNSQYISFVSGASSVKFSYSGIEI